MNDAFENIDELIAKKLAGETVAADEQTLNDWLNASAGNRLYFEQMTEIWRHSGAGQQELDYVPDVEAALTRTREKIRKQQQVSGAFTVRYRRYALAAAVALVLAAVWFLARPGLPEEQVLAAREAVVSDTLKDGSAVALNRHSRLSAAIDAKKRRVRLNGEAYFQVAHDEQKPFVVQVREVSVTVLGTQFNVDNLSDTNKVVVSVEQGRVKVQIGKEVIFLQAGEQASVDCASGRIERRIAPQVENASGWYNRRFVFDDVPLSEVIPILEEAYDTQIELKNRDLGKCRLHARFNEEPVERVLLVIAETFSLQLTNKNGRFQLDGADCGQ